MEELARIYSQSLFEVARGNNTLDVVREQLDQLAEALREDRELSFFFFSPYFSSSEKKRAVASVFVNADRHFINFLYVLLDKHRLPIIFRIRDKFESLYKQETRQLDVEVISAVELDRKSLDQIKSRVEGQTKRKVNLSDRVDNYLVGGLILKVGNTILDASIRNQLENLRKQVAAA